MEFVVLVAKVLKHCLGLCCRCIIVCPPRLAYVLSIKVYCIALHCICNNPVCKENFEVQLAVSMLHLPDRQMKLTGVRCEKIQIKEVHVL